MPRPAKVAPDVPRQERVRAIMEDGLGGRSLPAVVRASGGAPIDALLEWIATGRRELRARLLEVGAVLFRGFDVRGAADLARVVAAFGEGAAPRSYVGGDTPRTRVGQSVYTSTEAPASVRIPLHSEMSYLRTCPRYLFFLGETPAARGGETPLADARAVHRGIDPAVRERFVERGVRYVWSYRGPSRALDALDRVQKVAKSWMEVFDTDRPEVAEARCRELGMDFGWLPGGRLRVSTVGPAARAHPETDEPLWFNQAHLFCFSPRWMGRFHYAAASLLFAKAGTRSHDATYGDGRPIEPAALDHVHDVLAREAVRFPWERGDVLLVDNLLCMHGREPFRGRRRILVSMSG